MSSVNQKFFKIKVIVPVVSLLAIAFTLLLIFGPGLTYRDRWWNDSWPCRRLIVIDNSKNPETLSSYQVLVTMNTRKLVSSKKIKYDGSDIRFIDEEGFTELAYWIESGVNATSTRIWVTVPNIPGGKKRRIYLYYGNDDAKPRSDGLATFEFFSSFEAERDLPFGEGFERYPGNPLDIEAYNATGVVHPDLLYFPDGRDGYRFWMYYTPYPPDIYELPSLVRSQDGINFTDDGVDNPLVEAGDSGEWDDGFLADPDVIRVGDTWYLYYAARSANKSWQRIGLATSSDGKRFIKVEGNPVLSADVNLSHESHDYLLSPTVYHNETGFYMWYFAEGAEGGRTRIFLCAARSPNGINWTKLPQNPVMRPLNASLERNGIWHGDVVFLENSLLLYYVAYDGSEYHLCMATSKDGINWERSDENPVLDLVPESWEDLRIYRSSPVVVGDEVWMYYSAFNSSYFCRIGLAKSRQGLRTIRPDLSMWNCKGYASGSRFHARQSQYSLKLVGSKIPYPQVRASIGGKLDYTAWFYDDLSNETDYLATLRLFDADANFIGIGVYADAHLNMYVYHAKSLGKPPTYNATDMFRTRGWHRLSIRVESSSCRLYVDDLEVADIAVLDEDNLKLFSLEGYRGGVAYFDDIRVRKHSPPEPVVSIHLEQGRRT